MSRLAAECALLVAAGALTGVAAQALAPRPAGNTAWVSSATRLREAGRVAVAGAAEAPGEVGLAAMRDRPAGVLAVDARAAVHYRAGHIPGAVSLPHDEESSAFARHEAALRPASAVWVYCAGGSCPDAALVAAGLRRRGIREVRVFDGGWSAWSAAGLPAEESR